MAEGQFHQFNEDDFPSAEEFHEAEETIQDDFESQKQKIKEAVKKINKDRSTVDIVFKTDVSKELVPFLKSKGYDVKIYQFFDSRDDSYLTRVIVTNPSFKTPLDNVVEKVETQFKNFGFGGSVNVAGDANELFNQLFNAFK